MKLLEFNQPSESFRIRRVDHNDEDWFIARDICDSLGIDQTGPALAKLDPDEVNQIHLLSTGGKQLTYIVNESGLYAMILRSDKPAARAFRKWVTSEVLPALRRQGVYALNGSVPQETLRVRRLELQLRAAKLREQAVCLEMQGTLLLTLPGAVPVKTWLHNHRPDLGDKQRANLIRQIKRWAMSQNHPVGHIKRTNPGGGWHITMLPEHIEAYFTTQKGAQ